MTQVIRIQKRGGYTSAVGKVFTLNSLEELQLWLESLAVYVQHAGKPVASKESVPSGHNFRPDLKNTLIALRDEAKRCPIILHEELEIELAYLTLPMLRNAISNESSAIMNISRNIL